MTAEQAREKLCSLFGEGHVNAWLRKFPDGHRFDDKTLFPDFIDYINALPPFP